jgi:hypothetical protein
MKLRLALCSFAAAICVCAGCGNDAIAPAERLRAATKDAASYRVFVAGEHWGIEAKKTMEFTVPASSPAGKKLAALLELAADEMIATGGRQVAGSRGAGLVDLSALDEAGEDSDSGGIEILHTGRHVSHETFNYRLTERFRDEADAAIRLAIQQHRDQVRND